MKRILVLLAVLLAGTALPAVPRAQDAPAFSPQQREQVKDVIREFLLEHPEVVLDAINMLQKREQQATQDQQRFTIASSRAQLYAATEDASLGNPKARTVIVEFFDYRCPYCKSIAANLRKLVEEDKDLRIVLKEFPILGPDSIYAAKASLAASDQPRFADFHVALISAPGPLNEAAVGKIAAAFGIDFAKLKTRMEAPEIEAVISRNIALARSLGISGTPAFVIGTTVYSGAMENDLLKRLVRQARAAG